MAAASTSARIRAGIVAASVALGIPKFLAPIAFPYGDTVGAIANAFFDDTAAMHAGLVFVAVTALVIGAAILDRPGLRASTILLIAGGLAGSAFVLAQPGARPYEVIPTLLAAVLGTGVMRLMSSRRISRDSNVTDPQRRRSLQTLALAGLGAAGSVYTAGSASGSPPLAVASNRLLSADEFGAKGDGVLDDTDALQQWLDSLVKQGKQGWLPNGKYKITRTLVIPSGYGWGIHGENQNLTQIVQHTDNIPVLQVGTTNGEPSHTHILQNLLLTFAVKQPATNTNANCLVFQGRAGSSSTYWSTYRSLYFANGFYAMKVPEGMNVPWACEFDMLMMSEMSGGFYDNSGANTMGAPNNKWGRVTMYCDDSVGPIFNKWNTWSTTVGALEFLRAYKGPQLITTHPPFSADIGAVRLEVATYTPSTALPLIDFSGDHFVRLGVFDVGGSPSVFAPTGDGRLVGISTYSPNDDSYLEVSSVVMLGESMTGTCVAFEGGSLPNKRLSVGSVQLKNGWTLQDTGRTVTGNYLQVRSWVNGALSDNIGDNDYLVIPGYPNVVQFRSPFTKARTITLPSASSNNLCSGLYYDLVFDGAINGANIASIVQGEQQLRVQSEDKKRLRYQWRRGSAGGEWVLVDSSDLL